MGIVERIWQENGWAQAVGSGVVAAAIWAGLGWIVTDVAGSLQLDTFVLYTLGVLAVGSFILLIRVLVVVQGHPGGNDLRAVLSEELASHVIRPRSRPAAEVEPPFVVADIEFKASSRCLGIPWSLLSEDWVGRGSPFKSRILLADSPAIVSMTISSGAARIFRNLQLRIENGQVACIVTRQSELLPELPGVLGKLTGAGDRDYHEPDPDDVSVDRDALAPGEAWTIEFIVPATYGCQVPDFRWYLLERSSELASNTFATIARD